MTCSKKLEERKRKRVIMLLMVLFGLSLNSGVLAMDSDSESDVSSDVSEHYRKTEVPISYHCQTVRRIESIMENKKKDLSKLNYLDRPKGLSDFVYETIKHNCLDRTKYYFAIREVINRNKTFFYGPCCCCNDCLYLWQSLLPEEKCLVASCVGCGALVVSLLIMFLV